MANIESKKDYATVLVLGGGIAGMRAALDLAEAGIHVKLVESTPGLGGRVAQVGFMFPTQDCVLCRATSDNGYGCTRPGISPAFLDWNRHPNIQVLTNTQVLDVSGTEGDFSVSLRQYPRYVNSERCTNCGLCAEVCPVEKPREFEAGLSKRKAAYKIAPRAIPNSYVLDRGPYCDGCNRCEQVCPTHAISLNASPVDETAHVNSIILAIGNQLYDAHLSEEFGYGRFANVLTSMEFERLASRAGPTEGAITRPSDGAVPKKIAWLQCIGSRDQNHTYCSSICCMYATKQAIFARERIPEVESRIFLMDERAFNKDYRDYMDKAHEQYGLGVTRCRVSSIKEDLKTRSLNLQVVGEDGRVHQETYDMVVLSLGMEPPAQASVLARKLGVSLTESGFCETQPFAPLNTSRPGVYACGAISAPKEIAESLIEASGAAAQVMRSLPGQLGHPSAIREYPFLARDADLPPERDVTGEALRTGVFVCDCGGAISQFVDTDAVVRTASDLPGVSKAERVNFLCLSEGQARIRLSLAKGEINRVVVAACSHRTHEPLFQRVVREGGLNSYLLDQANIREQCAWVHRKDREAATRKAKEMVRMSVGRAATLLPAHKETLKPTQRTLIIGGGVSGMSAALAIADSGYEAVLVEREKTLGGNLKNLHFTVQGEDPQRLLRDLTERVQKSKRIQVYTNSRVVEHTGRVGEFTSTVETCAGNGSAPNRITIQHGATVVATGAQEQKGTQYGLGLDSRVMTQQQFEALLAQSPDKVATLKNVVFIQCVREPGTPQYCSRVCCTTTMKNALRIKALNPDCRVVVLYKDIVTYGLREQYYTEARKQGVLFVRYNDASKPKVEFQNERGESQEWNTIPREHSPLGRIQVRAQEPALNEELVFEPDLLVLSTAITPSDGTRDLAAILQVPVNAEGFLLEAHVKMRPTDFVEEGAFVAGMAQYPKFIEDSIAHALSASAHAITLMSQAPMYIGGTIAVVNSDKCVGCLTCVRVCPYEVPRIDPERIGNGGIRGAAWIDPARCQGCGTCTGECPATAIQLVNYRDEQMMLRESAGLGAWLPQAAAAN